MQICHKLYDPELDLQQQLQLHILLLLWIEL